METKWHTMGLALGSGQRLWGHVKGEVLPGARFAESLQGAIYFTQNKNFKTLH